MPYWSSSKCVSSYGYHDEVGVSCLCILCQLAASVAKSIEDKRSKFEKQTQVRSSLHLCVITDQHISPLGLGHHSYRTD